MQANTAIAGTGRCAVCRCRAAIRAGSAKSTRMNRSARLRPALGESVRLERDQVAGDEYDFGQTPGPSDAYGRSAALTQTG